MKNKNNIIIACVIGVVFGFIALLFSIAYCLIQDPKLLFKPSAKLRATIQYSLIRFPPKLQDEIRQLINTNASILRDSNVKKQILSNLEFDGYWSVVIKNKGNKTYTGVRLRLPYSEIFMIERDYLEPVISITNRVAFIENLAPLEEVRVYGWTHNYQGPHFKDKSNIQLTYDNGVGRVVLKLPLRQDWYYFSKLWPLLLFLWTGVVLCAVVLYFLIRHKESDNPVGYIRNRTLLM